MIPRLYATGFTFDPANSSCGRRQPDLFRWTADSRDENMGCKVFIGEKIISGIRSRSPKRKIAWFIESREVHRKLRDAIVDQVTKVEEAFEMFFTCDRDLASRLGNSVMIPAGSNLPWTETVEPRLATKSKLCSMICSPKLTTPGHRLRHEWGRRLHGRIDLFGGALNSPRLGSGAHPSKAGALNAYMFHLTIENASYDSYYTEKITDCFITGTIPVYFGSPDIGETFNEEGVICLEEGFDIRSLTQELYLSKREAVVDNFERTNILRSADDELFLNISNTF
jgi:hypothetical protein